MKPLQRATPIAPKWTAFAAHAMKQGVPLEEARKIYEEEARLPCWMNDLYVVTVGELESGAMHLSIRRTDRAPCRDWRHFQQIKNQLCGPEREGVELYPAESRVVDTANQFHIWVLPPGDKWPVGYSTGVRSDETGAEGLNFVQRAQP